MGGYQTTIFLRWAEAIVNKMPSIRGHLPRQCKCIHFEFNLCTSSVTVSENLQVRDGEDPGCNSISDKYLKQNFCASCFPPHINQTRLFICDETVK